MRVHAGMVRIIFTVTGDVNETAVSVDWPAVPRVGEIVQFGSGQHRGKELLVKKVVYAPMLSFVDIGNGHDSHDGLLVTVALKVQDGKKEIIECVACNGTGVQSIMGAVLACPHCDSTGKILANKSHPFWEVAHKKDGVSQQSKVVPCRLCDGTGHIGSNANVVCPDCNVHGRYAVDE